MVLISCRECGKQVSDTAPTCPQCGAPMAKNPRVSIQRTSQRIKRQELLGSILLALSLGLVQAVLPGSPLGNLLGLIGVLGFVAGLVLLAKARLGRWWYHG